MVRVNPLGHFQSLNCQFLRQFRGIPGSLRGLVPGLRAESGASCGDGGDELLRGAFRVATLLRAALKGGHPWPRAGRAWEEHGTIGIAWLVAIGMVESHGIGSA